MRKLVILSVGLALSACSSGPDFEGEYCGSMGGGEVEFEFSGDQVKVIGGPGFESQVAVVNYEVDGETLRLFAPDGSETADFTIKENGNLRHSSDMWGLSPC